MSYTAGRFAIDVWRDGFPRSCQLGGTDGLGRKFILYALERGDLQDLQHAVGRALEDFARLEREDERRKL